MVEVPRLKSIGRKVAPAVDPYLKPGTVTAETITLGDIELPPILSGVEEGKGLQGQPVNYHVKVMHISRRQIDWALTVLEQQHPELEPVLHIVSRWMCAMDTMRDEAKFGIACSMTWLRGEKPDPGKAVEQLAGVVEMLGKWHDERRIHLR